MFRHTRLHYFCLVCVALVGIHANPLAHAQSGALNLTMTAEENIGFDCPVTSTLDPSGTTLWVLMDDCFNQDYTLRSFGVGDGQALNDDAHNFAAALAGLQDANVDPVYTALSFTPDGALTIIYTDADYQPVSLSIPAGADGSDSTTGSASNPNVGVVADYTDYPETAIYSADQTQAIAVAADSLHVVDLQTGTEILAMDIPGGNYNAYASFSADGTQLYVSQFNNPDDMTATASTLYVYSLPDGELVATYDVPSWPSWVSPNGQFAAVLFGSNDGTSEQIAVVELGQSNPSQILEVYEEPRKATTCLNTGDDISDVDWEVSGKLPIIDLEWLPDSSGFVTVNSYLGEGAEGDNNWDCIFNYSRLRHYSLSFD